jgi:hypothetical protein
MWDRLFGRGKQELPAEPTCAACGRTLLPGEWAQTVVREDGVEEVVCSLCAQAHDIEPSPHAYDATVADFEDAVGQPPSTPAAEYAPEPRAVTGRPQHSRGRTPPEDGDAQWQAIREKDAEIARLQVEIARLQAHNQELDARLTQSTPASAAWAPAAVAGAQQWAPEAPAASQWESDQPAARASLEPAEASAQQAEQPAPETAAEAWAQEPVPETAAEAWAQEPVPETGAEAWAQEPVPEAAQWTVETPAATDADAWQVGQPADVDAALVEQPAPEAAQWPGEQAPQWPEVPSPETGQWPAEQPVPAAAGWAAAESPGAEDASEVTAEWAAAGAEEAVPSPDARPLAATAAAAAVTDEWTGRSQMPAGPAGEWPVAAPLEGVAPYGPSPGAQLEMTGDALAHPAIVDMPTEPLAVYETNDADFCPACDTAEMPAVAPLAAGTDDEATMQIPAAIAAQQIVFEPQPEPADLHLLERGADLFNVSPMPHKVAESNELLGLPAVHLSSDGDVITALFLWSMAWYEYRIDLSSGDVVLADRGYDDRGIDRPNSTTKPDGTIQLAPLPARRAVVQPAPLPPGAGTPMPGVDAPITDDPQPIVPGKGDIISKSLKGQRTDDEGVAWDEMGARDFDWGR